MVPAGWRLFRAGAVRPQPPVPFSLSSCLFPSTIPCRHAMRLRRSACAYAASVSGVCRYAGLDGL